MKYYIARGGQPAGPFEKENLLKEGLLPSTLVWREGMSNWKKAEDMEELKGLFPTLCPPPLPKMPSPPPLPPTPANESPTNMPASPKASAQVHSDQNPCKGKISLKRWKAKIDGKESALKTKSQLAEAFINENTPVCAEGGSQWKPAGEVAELSAMLKNEPAPGAPKPVTFYISMGAQGGLNVSNGHIFIFEDYIVLWPSRASSVMMGNYSRTGYVNQYYGLEEIVGFKKGLLMRKYLLLADGRKVFISCKQKIIDTIIEKRQSFYAKQGLTAPEFRVE